MMIRFSPRSEFPSGVISVGERELRLSERLPAASVGTAQAVGFIPFKATNSRKNSDDIRALGEVDPLLAVLVIASRYGSVAQNAFSRASRRIFSAARSSLKLCKLAHSAADIFALVSRALFDAFAVGFLAAFASLLGASIVGAFAILLFYSL